MPSGKLTIDYLPVASLRLDPKNARLHSNKQVRQIARSIEVFGFNVPILVDADFRVVAGHGRVLACKQLRIAQVPVVRLEHLSEHQIRAFMIADNRLAENSDWDNHLLGEQLQILSQAKIDFTLEVTGFETAEIDLFIENLASPCASQADPDDILPEATSIQVSRTGDLWQLGKNRILCGDALSPGSYEALMDGQKAQLVFADPIYGYVSRFGKIDNPEFLIASGEVSENEFTKFLIKVFGPLGRSSSDGALQFICMEWRHIPELLAAARQTYTEFKNLCAWYKDVAGPGSLYRSQHELVFIFKNGKCRHRNNVQLSRHRTNVWQYSRVNSSAGTAEREDLSNLQPTIRPVELVADVILDCTARGEIVLDPFVESGTTAIAAGRTGRVCFGIELNPLNVDTTIRRWQSFTHQQAVNAVSGRTFNEVEEGLTDG
jgi:DNA modification methylase